MNNRRKQAGGLWLMVVIALAGSVLVSPAVPAQAASAYGTRLPEKKQCFWGLQHYYIRRRNLDNDRGTVHSQQNYLTLSYGLLDWLSLDLKGSLYSTFWQENPAGERMAYKDPVWGGGYGFRVRLYENDLIRMTAGFQHFSIHPATVKANGSKSNGILEDWQASWLVSRRFALAVPYVGLRYTALDYIHRRDNVRKLIKSDESRRLGIIAGVDIPLSDRVWMNLETDWQDGGAMTTALHWRF